MTLPGATVEIIDAAPPVQSLTATGTAFIAGLFDRGATTGNITSDDALHSMSDVTTRLGARQTYNGNEYDTLEAFFTEGGSTAYVSRFAGPSAVIASGAVPASSSKFTAKAKGPGSYGNALTVAVATSVITVKQSGVTVEVSPTLADVAAAQAWATDVSGWINIVPIGSGALTDSAAVALTLGADDRTSVTDTERGLALARLTKDLGPGQVALPGDTRTLAHTLIAQHALDTNRFAMGDLPDTTTAATVVTAALAVRALGRDLARHIQLLDGWMIVPGLTVGTTRTIPPSGVQMGMIARSDRAGNPNRAVAGSNGVSRFATKLKNVRSDTDRGLLADAGATVYVSKQGQTKAYDDVTPVDPVTDPEWLGAGGNRFVMRVIADALAIGEAHMFGATSGQVDLDAFGGDLKGMLARWYATPGALFGDTPAEAFRVETGPSVNTTETLAARQLRAALALKIAPNARQVVVQITNTPLGATL